MQFKLKTWWKNHAPGDIVEATMDEIHSLICVGGADLVKPAEQSAKEARQKAVTDVKPGNADSST